MRDDYSLLERIQPELEQIHARLENWAQWSRDRRPQGHCRSIEYRYKPESGETWDGPAIRTEYDILGAVALHDAIADMPLKHRLLLHYWYIHKLPVWSIRRKLAVRIDRMGDELNRARRMAENRSRRTAG